MQSNYPSAAPYHNPQNFIPEHSLHQGSDPNSPEVFKQSLQIVQEHVTRVQDLAGRALSGIQTAYHPSSNPAQTEADIAALKQTMRMLSDIMRHTGVGALPLLSMNTAPAGSTEQMIGDTTRAIQVIYDKLKRSQEGAAVVANLLTSDCTARSGGKDSRLPASGL
jgi:hypothetical protein